MADNKTKRNILIGLGVVATAGLVWFLFFRNKTEKKEEKQALQDAYDNLQFEMGKDVIIPTSYPSLTILGNVLKQAPEWSLKLSGHTDNTGTAAFNLNLSKKRAEAVKKYLVSLGIAPERITTEGLGSTKPIASNDTKEGRDMNRRVEFFIIKDKSQVLTT